MASARADDDPGIGRYALPFSFPSAGVVVLASGTSEAQLAPRMQVRQAFRLRRVHYCGGSGANGLVARPSEL